MILATSGLTQMVPSNFPFIVSSIIYESILMSKRGELTQWKGAVSFHSGASMPERHLTSAAWHHHNKWVHAKEEKVSRASDAKAMARQRCVISYSPYLVTAFHKPRMPHWFPRCGTGLECKQRRFRGDVRVDLNVVIEGLIHTVGAAWTGPVYPFSLGLCFGIRCKECTMS